MPMTQTRRRFLTTLSLAGAASFAPRASVRWPRRAPLETTTVRLAKSPAICIAPQYVAEELLRAEGLYRYPLCRYGTGDGASDALARGEVDFSSEFCVGVRRKRSMPVNRSRCWPA